MGEELTYYNLGHRDAAAGLMALVRKVGPEKAVLEWANWLAKADPENPHAQAVINLLSHQGP